MPRKKQGWITFQASEEERKILDKLSQESQRSKTEILRELVRGLNPRISRFSTKQYQADAEIDSNSIEINNYTEVIKFSSYNVIKGIVTKVTPSQLSSQVTLRVVHEIELTSVITSASIDELDLHEGTEVYAVINPYFVALGRILKVSE
ncbi:TOBE domain-containing protein [Calothrix sp. UHCC 0171]|uniref:TOBE domain-containing protein n=1 Tax=Calothrix sp. UHCC 0171 TaxID=3110245 RepID=UPI002B1F12E6|nr:TOBE domain-containing protein [Calothrix sp. UHCC 0171]MEA5574519.1 TOBE domain-containing protein [Calothrix sp. UHCC 0171]